MIRRPNKTADDYRTIHKIPRYSETLERLEPEIPIWPVTRARSARASRAGIVASETRIASGDQKLRHSGSASARKHRAS